LDLKKANYFSGTGKIFISQCGFHICLRHIFIEPYLNNHYKTGNSRND